MTGSHEPRGGSTRTDPRAPDPLLRGRTYAIPFDPVWEAALALVRGGLPGWTLLGADDNAGLIEGEALTRLLKRALVVGVRVGLDRNAQTRVDLEARSRSGGPDLGARRRIIVAFFNQLDRRLAARPEQILDATGVS